MDSRGWIPISLIASFNRIKALTLDMRVVKDVFILSSVVEVVGDWCRMGSNQWEQFVLPDARPSTVEKQLKPEGGTVLAHSTLTDREANLDAEGSADAESLDAEAEEDDEDDVVFVMEQNA